MAVSVTHSVALGSGYSDSSSSAVSKTAWNGGHVVSGLVPTPNGVQMAAGYTSYRMMVNGIGGYGGGTFTFSAGREYWVPWRQDMDITVNRALLEITTGVASTGVKIAFFALNSDGTPGALVGDLCSVNAFSSVTAGGVMVVAGTDFTAFPLPAGWYWMRMISNGAPTIRVFTTSPLATFMGIQGATGGGIKPPGFLFRSGDYTYVPANNPTFASVAASDLSNFGMPTLALGGF